MPAGPATRRRADSRHGRVHVARTGGRTTRRRAVGPVFPRCRALRDGDGTAKPFTGDTSISIISSIVKDTPKPVTELNPSLPRDLGRIIRHALVKDPERRYQSAKDLRNDLEDLQGVDRFRGTDRSARRDRLDRPSCLARGCTRPRLDVDRCRCRRRPRHCCGVALAAVAAAGARCAIGDRVAGRRQPGIPGEFLGAPAISPDGTTVVLTFGSGPKTHSVLRRLDSDT